MPPIQRDQPKQHNPLLPGYAFDFFLVSGLTTIEQGGHLDFIVGRPGGMKGYIINMTMTGGGKVFSGDEAFKVAPGELLLFPPGVPHYYCHSTPTRPSALS